MHKQPGQVAGFSKAALALMLLAFTALKAQADPVTLGQATNFGVLAGSTITNTGTTVVFTSVGVSPGTAITGFPPGIIVGGAIHANDALAQQAQTDLTTAYNVIAGETPTQNLTGQDLGSRTLTPGVYHFDTSAPLTGALVLDAQGDPNARFDFQIGTTLTTASSSTVTLINGGIGNNVFWQVGSSATIGSTTTFTGNTLAYTSITLGSGATVTDGRVLARNGAVTLDTNTIGSNVIANGVPEPSFAVFLGCVGLLPIFVLLRRRGQGKGKSSV